MKLNTASSKRNSTKHSGQSQAVKAMLKRLDRIDARKPIDDIYGYGFCKCGCGQKTAICQRNCSAKGYIKGEPFDYIFGHSQKNKTPVMAQSKRKWASGGWL